MDPRQQVMIGPYTLGELIGRGGMGAVYIGRQPALGRVVAIKVLPSFLDADPEFRERFRQEGVAIAALRHPNILTVFDSGEDQGQLYLVTEYLPGGSLAAQVGSPRSLASTLALLGPIADALDYAHGRGVLHRDVKPSNILLTADGTPVLADFGLARMTDALTRLTQTGASLGTPEYMAPELADGAEAGSAADRYSLAIVAYELLTGRAPFQASTPLAVLLAHLQRSVPPPRALNPSLSVVAEALVRGLAKAPEGRFPTARAFVEALAGTGAALPGPASPPATPAAAPATDQIAAPKGEAQLGTGAVAAHPGSVRHLTRRAALAGAAAVAAAGGGLALALRGGAFSSGNSTPSSIVPAGLGRWIIAQGAPDGGAGQAAVALRDGRVLLAGGYDRNGGLGTGASLYDATHDRWMATGTMRRPRVGFPLLLLADGRVLAVGSADSAGNAAPDCELYDPFRRSWLPTGSLRRARFGHTCTLLPEGRVLAAGGNDARDNTIPTAELWDPKTGTWTLIAGPAHSEHTATLLASGRVLVADGLRSDLYVPDSGAGRWIAAAPMPMPHWNHTATLLRDGTVLVASGNDYRPGTNFRISLNSALRYDPTKDRWHSVGAMHDRRTFAAAALLPSGQVLVAGGQVSEMREMLSTAELYDPVRDAWLRAAPLPQPRSNGEAVPLPGGRILLAAGNDTVSHTLATLAIYSAEGKG